MKFKEGDIVRLKHPTEEEKKHDIISYTILFETYEGSTATIRRCLPHYKAYNIDINQPKNGAYDPSGNWNYSEEWLEPMTEYKAF